MFAKKLPSYPRDLLSKATYQSVAGPAGLPQIRLELRFSPTLPTVVNPDMALGLVLDRSGSMTETYADGHVFNAANSVLLQVGASGFELAFYDRSTTIAGHIASSDALRDAIRQNLPNGGGTTVSPTLRTMIERLRARKPDVYVIVVTDGEFSDKMHVRQYIVNELIPSIPAHRPNALRLHFVGAGHEVDHEFLRQLESEAANEGAALVRQHHHAHLRHSHTDIGDELATVYLGVGSHVRLDDPSGTMTRAGIASDGPLRAGPSIETPFLPRTAFWIVEHGIARARELPLTLAFRDARGDDVRMPLTIPLPAGSRVAPAAAASDTGAGADTAAPLPGGPPSLAGNPRRNLFAFLKPPSPEALQRRRERDALVANVRAAELVRQSADLRDLAAGGIPTSARERLQNLARTPGAFTSDLAPEELGLLRSKGFRPRGLVTGSAMYHVGTAYASSTGDCEVRVLSEAYTVATQLAVSRMHQELHALRAHGAVGVRLTMVRHEWADKTVEVQIIGTAVDGPGAAPRKPWLSDLSGQEWYALNRAGYDPVGLVYGHCTWFVLTTPQDEWTARSYSNVELRHQSEGLSRARHVAMNAVTRSARALGASGVTGTHIARRVEEVRLGGPDENPVYEYEHHNVTLSVVGTAIKLRADAPASVPATRHVLSLRDNRFVPISAELESARFE